MDLFAITAQSQDRLFMQQLAQRIESVERLIKRGAQIDLRSSA